MGDTESTTKERLLDTAEKLFAENGITGTSLRAIIKEAGVNTAAVHYHYGSREALIGAVIARRARPINDERLDLLGRLEEQHPSGPLPLERVIEAFLTPIVRIRFGREAGGALFPRLMGWLLTEPDPVLRDILQSTFGEVFKRFSAVFARALPGLSQEQVQWRMHFMVGAMVFTVAVPRVFEDGSAGAEDQAALLQRLVQFVAAGMQSDLQEAS